MTTERRKTRREIADQSQRALGAVGLFTLLWAFFYLTSDVVDPFGLLSLLADVSLLLAGVAGLALMVVASSLLRR